MENNEREFHDAVIDHKEPKCPKCHKGRIVCHQGKIEKPHFFVAQMIADGI